MNRADVERSTTATAAPPSPREPAPAEVRDATHSDATAASDAHAANPATPIAAAGSTPSGAPAQPWRKWLMWSGIVVLLAWGSFALVPAVKTMMETVSTDDAYVNGHVTYVAPRVAGEVSQVFVDDNDRVSKGDLLVQLDKEPYQIQVDLKKAAVVNAEADLQAARAVVRGILALARSQRWKLQRAIEDVDDKVAQVKARVAALRGREATHDLAKIDLHRTTQLFNRGAAPREELDRRVSGEHADAAAVQEALEQVYEARVALGLDPHPEGKDLTDVPADINQTFSGVTQALNELMQTMAHVGLPLYSVKLTPQQALDEFVKRDKDGDIDRILERMVPEAPAIRQAEAKLLTANRDLAQAELNLRYCDIVSEIDGVVTRRNVNPGNNVSPGQSVMAVRSLTDIWIDANFKETQLADLCIGQPVRVEVDMYGGRKEFEGRITGFTMGTGQMLSLLPPQNATGNFVKIVQRLPVKIELTNYDPDKVALFAGLSVTPYVYYKEPPKGPHAGEVLRPLVPRAKGRAVSGGSTTSQSAARVSGSGRGT